MSKKYNQGTALKALTKASLLALLKSPSAIFFSIAFPLLFIIAFGVMSDGGIKVTLAFDSSSDTSNAIYRSLNNIPVVKVYSKTDTMERLEDLKKGNIAALIKIKNSRDSTGKPFYSIDFITSIASGNDRNIAKQILVSTINTIDKKLFLSNNTIATIHEPPPIEGRPYKYLDFFLPGMLGFSMLSAGIFGTAFLFFNLRQTLVLKRFFATPIKRINIIIAEGTSRLLLQMLAAAIIIIVGYFVFDFTLVHGFSTFFQMMVLCFFGLIIFLGMGFIISSVAKNEALIPPLANMITMPQLLLSGVFLSINNFPEWLQPFCKALPLTNLNDALRAVAFQGKNILEVWQPILILSLWGVLVYIVAVKVFRWE